ncbi:anti-sigma factor family protein [Cupriavidus basilensis]|uniref:anti-sigma factor family protein n=2 Tax=Cupriavidus TaxID=106589 RepID=UPI0007513C00|nr:anti-sigma factor [Cupriavidus basilensis]
MMPPISESDLHAYADGRLDPSRRAEVEAFLAAHPEAAGRVGAWRRQAQELHAALDGVLNEAVPLRALPPRLQGRAAGPAARAAGWRMALAASMASLVAGGAAGWLAHGHADDLAARAPSAERFAREALASHVVYAPEVRHPVEVAASDEAHLVAWLSKRLGAPLRVPDLRAEGYRLIGGRLGVAEGGPSAMLMYEADNGSRVSLQLRHMAPGTADAAFRLERLPGNAGGAGAAAAFYWVDRDLGFALAGPLERAALLALAQAVYRQYQDG